VENLLEAYFMYIDIAHQKLQAIGEFIDDTEDFVNLELDYSRNRCAGRGGCEGGTA
jgi:hypothetical protein